MRTLAVMAICLFVSLVPCMADDSGGAGQAPAGAATPPVAPAPAAGTPSAAPEQTVPQDKRTSWTVAFTALDAQALPVEESYLAFSVPLLLKDRTSALADHALPDVELAAYRKRIVDAEIQVAYQNIVQLRHDRDDTLFVAPANAQVLTDIEARLKTARERIAWLEALDLAQIEVAEKKPVVVKEGTGVGKLFDPPRYSPARYAALQDVDLLVGGTASEVQGYVIVDVWAYEPVRDEMVYTFHDAAQRESVYTSLDEAAKGLTGIILGREWAALTVISDPPEGTTFIDDESLGSGRVQTAYLDPGVHQVRVSAPGFKDEARTVELAPYAEQSLSIALDKEPRSRVAMISEPLGADVYLDSVWVGKTPLDLELPAVRSKVQLDHADFYDLPFSLGPDSPPALSLTLQKDTGSRDDKQKKARNDFYLALGFFALSIPIPVFCYSYSTDYAADLTRLTDAGSIAEADKAYTTGYAFYYSYLGGLGLSASLFTWTVIELVRYIMTANRTAG